MNVLPLEKQTRIIHMLVEGSSMRSISRVVDVSINTVTKLLVETGKAAQIYHDKHAVNLPCTNIEVDEIWSFCFCKRDKVKMENKGVLGFGDVWTWTSICQDSKFVPYWLSGTRKASYAKPFLEGLKLRLANRIQLSSDGYAGYFLPSHQVFGKDVDHGMLVKLYAGKTLSIAKHINIGNPDASRISTSAVERQNLTMRMSMKRFTRHTNAHSKKLENHWHALALYFMWYNYGRIHQSLKITPAMALGISDHVWSLEEILALRQSG